MIDGRERATRSSKIKAPLAMFLLLTLTSQLFPTRVPADGFRPVTPSLAANAEPTVTLGAASGATIRFRTQNGRAAADGTSSQTMDLPHLVLYRNTDLTDPQERTLIVEIANLQAPPKGATVTIEVTTQHGNPDFDSGETVSVWRESKDLASISHLTETGVTAVLTHEFTETVDSSPSTLPTPTDYFRIEVTIIDQRHPKSDPWYSIGKEYAFLMENQWVVPLPGVYEESVGAAPDELIVYYCDMVPFRKSDRDVTSWLPRHDIPHFVGAELIPRMIEAFRVQADTWGFLWHGAWTSHRADDMPGRLSVALSDGETWFHGGAPFRGHAGISIKVNAGENALYATLADGILSTFHHELFHNVQRSIDQGKGGDGNLFGKEEAWRLVSDGTAVLASSVGQPTVQFAQTSVGRAYVSSANRFLSEGRLFTALNASYEEINNRCPACLTLYWRFLYEQCGGMQVTGQTLTGLYSRDVVDITSSTDLVGNLSRIMDHALLNSSCPFQTHEDSLIQFARAIYALRLDGGRCSAPGTPAGCGFYDPNSLYLDPPVSALAYTGTKMQHAGRIKGGFGIDFVDVSLASVVDGQSLTIEFSSAEGAGAEFAVQLWRLISSGSDTKPQRVPSRTGDPEILTTADRDGRLSYTIPTVDTAQFNQLGLIITRTDAEERSDPVGEYTVLLHS